MKPRTFARRPSSMGSNQLSKSRSSASPGRADVVTLVMAWSPLRRSNAGISRVEHPGDYATLNSNHPRDGTVVSDFTCPPGSPRANVYFEAGFGLALGKPVVWTCRDDMVGALQFDTRQYNYIRWASPDELRTKLRNRIVA